jgi:hypothetical protein
LHAVSATILYKETTMNKFVRPAMLLAAVMGFVPQAVAEQPNIVFFFVDDMGWQDTSEPFHTEATRLNTQYETPAMERLADEGLKFTHANAAAICSPSRVSLMTGLGNLKINDETIKRALIDSLNDDDVMVRGAAARGLLLLGPSKQASETFVTLLGEDHGYNNLVLLNVLELLGSGAKDVVAKSSTFVSSKSPARVGNYILWAIERLNQQ